MDARRNRNESKEMQKVQRTQIFGVPGMLLL
jgi:hypothetical protein